MKTLIYNVILILSKNIIIGHGVIHKKRKRRERKKNKVFQVLENKMILLKNYAKGDIAWEKKF